MENMKDTVNMDADKFDTDSVKKAESDIKRESGKWITKQCPLVFSNKAVTIVKFDNKFNLQFDTKNVKSADGNINVEYQGALGKPNFMYRIKV